MSVCLSGVSEQRAVGRGASRRWELPVEGGRGWREGGGKTSNRGGGGQGREAGGQSGGGASWGYMRRHSRTSGGSGESQASDYFDHRDSLAHDSPCPPSLGSACRLTAQTPTHSPKKVLSNPPYIPPPPPPSEAPTSPTRRSEHIFHTRIYTLFSSALLPQQRADSIDLCDFFNLSSTVHPPLVQLP